MAHALSAVTSAKQEFATLTRQLEEERRSHGETPHARQGVGADVLSSHGLVCSKANPACAKTMTKYALAVLKHLILRHAVTGRGLRIS